MFLATGLLAALVHARATGEGQVVDAAMTEGASYLGSMTRTFAAQGGWKDEREANMLDGGAPNYRCYECADGKWVAVGALETQFWSALVTTLGLDAASTPSPYVPDEWDACKKVLGDTFRTRTRDEWAAIFAPLDACVAPVLTLEEALHHPHNVARGTFTAVADAPMPAPAPRFSATPGRAGEVAEVGAATTEILADLGYDETGIAELRRCGAIA
jgi:alpha-methylacyl-CoA racemase